MQNIDVYYEQEFVVITMRMNINDWINMIKPKMPVICKTCGSPHVQKNGHNDKGKQKWRCMNDKCEVFSFVEE